MALFRRKPKNTVLPEVDQYYEGERRDRAGLAWLLALVSVAVVALVLIGAFLGGRWIYRQITQNDADETVSVVDEGELPSFDGSSDDTDEGEVDSDSDVDTGRVDAPAQTDTPSTPSETPAAGGDEGAGNESLPQTGAGSLAAVFLTVSVLGAAGHNAVNRLRTTSKK